MVNIKRATGSFSTVLPTDRSLWHLFSTKNLYKLDTFLSGELYLARLDRFNDPLEGALPRRNRSLLNKAPSFEKRYIRAAYRQAVRQSFATCWHRSSGEPSDFVWNQFGGNHNGVPLFGQTAAKEIRHSELVFHHEYLHVGRTLS